MSGFSQFVLSFCTVCITIGGLYILVPNGAFAKPVRYVFCLVFICCILASVNRLSRIDFNLDIREPEDTISEESVRLTATEVFAEALRKSGIEFSKITVCTDKLDSGSITITEVTVYSSDTSERINAVINASNAFEVTVINE